MVRVVDSTAPQNNVTAAPVVFLTTVLRRGGTDSLGGETNPGNPAMPVILSVSQTSTATDVNGLANVVPSSGTFSPPLEVDVSITAGTSAYLDVPLELYPAPPGGSRLSPSPPRTNIARPVLFR
jgi:hypothetical protein